MEQQKPTRKETVVMWIEEFRNMQRQRGKTEQEELEAALYIEDVFHITLADIEIDILSGKTDLELAEFILRKAGCC